MRTVSNYGMPNQANNQKGAILPVRTPEGKPSYLKK
jgi:hypothetical protein